MTSKAFATTGAQAEGNNARIGTLSFTHDFANGCPTKGLWCSGRAT